jgi:hypothetical protein
MKAAPLAIAAFGPYCSVGLNEGPKSSPPGRKPESPSKVISDRRIAAGRVQLCVSGRHTD